VEVGVLLVRSLDVEDIRELVSLQEVNCGLRVAVLKGNEEHIEVDVFDLDSVVGIHIVYMDMSCCFFDSFFFEDSGLVVEDLEETLLALVGLVVLQFEDFVDEYLSLLLALITFIQQVDESQEVHELFFVLRVLAQLLQILLGSQVNALLKIGEIVGLSEGFFVD
jgi:hypothetical protein